jgi:hypothetical protein
MSFDLYVWKGPIVRTGEAASALVGRSLDATSPFDPSADVVGFYRELIATYPPLEAFPEADLIAETATTHWSVSPGPSDRFIEMHLQWGTPDKVLDFITALARRHALVLFDPQGPDVHLPDDPEEWPPFHARRRDPGDRRRRRRCRDRRRRVGRRDPVRERDRDRGRRVPRGDGGLHLHRPVSSGPAVTSRRQSSTQLAAPSVVSAIEFGLRSAR